uniref:UV excision repair protein RAD23 n=1 Tax=Heterorhabditis bacteriophora TaxID=37862 RepID=A0A1I7XPY8_HETBA
MQTITFKTITQLSFTLDLDPKQTIADVKKQIAAEKGEDYAVELQKLIYNGKILDDATTVEQAAFDANKFIVVMLSRVSFTADQEASIEAIQGMGYPKDQVVAALRAAYWNAERAVEYLLTGIPEEETMPILVEGQEEENTEDIGSGADLAHLRDLPQLEELRALVRTNPEILPTLIQVLVLFIAYIKILPVLYFKKLFFLHVIDLHIFILHIIIL